MKVQLKFKINPISTNDAYYRGKSYNFKARKWRASFLTQLQSDANKELFKSITPVFNPYKHGLRLCFTWILPADSFFTKDGKITRRSMDVDNLLKIPTDVLCNAKYNGAAFLDKMDKRERNLYDSIQTLSNLNIDDQYILDTRSIKMPSPGPDYLLIVDIELIDLPKRFLL